jgi:hypothetical protein
MVPIPARAILGDERRSCRKTLMRASSPLEEALSYQMEEQRANKNTRKPAG